jgi:hypothetical protein
MGSNYLSAMANMPYEDFSLDYLHYGTALDFLPSILSGMEGWNSRDKNDAIVHLHSLDRIKAKVREHSLDIVRSFGGVNEKRLSISDFISALDRSRRWKTLFHSLRCRGFSFRFCEGTLKARTREHVNINFALVTDFTLYYPPQVRADLAKFSPRHIQGGIGWLLGTEQNIDQTKWWFILNLQSDAMSAQANSLREIFKGWQRVLFLMVAASAAQRGVSHIAIPSTSAVIKAATGDSNGPKAGARNTWHSLYEGTAEFFGLKRGRIAQSVDLQTMSWREPVKCRDFFQINVSQLMRRMTDTNGGKFSQYS